MVGDGDFQFSDINSVAAAMPASDGKEGLFSCQSNQIMANYTLAKLAPYRLENQLNMLLYYQRTMPE